jgi:hypothetical protein
LTTNSTTTRPMIWVTPEDHAPIWEKIKSQPWASDSFNTMQKRVEDAVHQHQQNSDTFLRGLPLLENIVRTSSKTGYYVDVFRSKSEHADQFHDYLYHNIGDAIHISSDQGNLPLTDSPDRFVPADGTQWVQNKFG